MLIIIFWFFKKYVFERPSPLGYHRVSAGGIQRSVRDMVGRREQENLGATESLNCIGFSESTMRYDLCSNAL
jgi:hypothetical protein